MKLCPVHHVVPSIKEEAAGPSYSVPALAMATARRGRPVTIHASQLRELPEKSVKLRSYPHFLSRIPIARSLRLAPGLKRRLAALPDNALVHGHGLWLMPNVISAASGARSGIKVIHAPRGMLGPGALQFSARRKRLFWTLLQKRAMAHVDCWHATSEKEIEDIRNFGLRQPIALIPNGVDVPSTQEQPAIPSRKSILFLGRIHPKKGIDTLLRVWKRLQAEIPDWHLEIAGPDDNEYGRQYRAFVQTHSLQRVRFLGPLYGEEKDLAYRRASLFVLPTLDENFGLTVAEALVRETPAIVSHGAPWEGLEANDCGWWYPLGEKSLLNTLRAATRTDKATLLEMGKNGRNWISEAFSWTAISRDMDEVYDWLTGRADRPGSVIVD